MAADELSASREAPVAAEQLARLLTVRVSGDGYIEQRARTSIESSQVVSDDGSAVLIGLGTEGLSVLPAGAVHQEHRTLMGRLLTGLARVDNVSRFKLQDQLLNLRKSSAWPHVPRPPRRVVEGCYEAMTMLSANGWQKLAQLLHEACSTAASSGSSAGTSDGDGTSGGVAPARLASVLDELTEDEDVAAVLEVYAAALPHALASRKALLDGGNARARARATAPRRSMGASSSRASTAGAALRRAALDTAAENMLQLACASPCLEELAALATGGAGGSRVPVRVHVAMQRLALRLRSSDRDPFEVPPFGELLELLRLASCQAAS